MNTTRRITNGNQGAHPMTKDEQDELIHVATRFHALLSQHNDEIEQAKADAAAIYTAKKALAETEAEVVKHKAANLAAYEAKIKTMFNAQHQYDTAIFEAKAELERWTKDIAEGERLHGAIQAAIEKSKARHVQIEAMQEEYRKRIAAA